MTVPPPVLQPPALNIVPVLVTFDASNLADPISMDVPEVSVPQGISFITLTLETTNLPQGEEAARFQTSPIQWFEYNDPNTPILPPEMFVVQRINHQYVTLVDFNSAPEESRHRFNVVVAYKGLTYGSDPTIINEPPSPPT